ncbi:Signal transduction histidine kinase [Flavobacteriaceae bacterium MAR_2010_188]|nr:Signal transduction histidine kinase [Flavobacteriaceae bacterium MAR_2010_188]
MLRTFIIALLCSSFYFLGYSQKPIDRDGSYLVDSLLTLKYHKNFELYSYDESKLAEAYLDSLKILAKKNVYPPSKYYYYFDLGMINFLKVNLNTSENYFQKSLEIAKKLDVPINVIQSKIWLANHKYFQNDSIVAKSLYDEILIESKRLNYEEGVANAYYGLAGVSENSLKSLRLLLKVDSIYTNANKIHPILANSHVAIGSLYLNRFNNIPMAKKYFESALRIADSSKYESGIDFLMVQLTKINRLENDSLDSYKLIDSLLERSIRNKDTIKMARYLSNLAHLKFESQNFDTAKQFGLKSRNYFRMMEDSIGITGINLLLSELYISTNDTMAARNLLDSLEIHYMTLEETSFIKKKLSLEIALQKLNGNYRSALRLHEQLDSLINAENIKNSNSSFFELERKYQVNKKEQEIALLTSQTQLAEEKRVNQRNLFLTVIILLFLTGSFFYFLFQNKQRINLKLKELDQAKTDFFANISHEFRTPLTLISGPIQKNLKKDNLEKEQRQELEMMDRNANKLLSLVNQLMAISKIESGKLKLQIIEDDLLFYVKSVFNSYLFAADEKQIQFTWDIQGSKDRTFFDKDIIDKILVNLISNAIKYTPQNGKILAKAKIEEGEFQLEIKNTGKGLTAAERENIFMRFYQVNNQIEGVGIGLALVKELVELHKGNIKVESIPNEWIIFKVMIKVAKDYFKSDEFIAPLETTFNLPSFANEYPENNSESIEPDNDKEILLIVEDNADVLSYIRNIFQNNYFILEAENGVKGIDLAIQHIPDIIISDIMMPIKNGIELCETLKADERTSHIPLILLTAKAGIKNEIEGIKTGADDYITKPFNEDLLVLKVEKLLEGRKKLRERYSQELILKPQDIAINSVEVQFLKRVQKVMDMQLEKSDFTTVRFAEELGISRMQLHRKLKALTGLSATEFMKSQRLKLATTLLSQGDANISEISYMVGFNDPSYFTKCFKATYGCSPKEYQSR